MFKYKSNSRENQDLMLLCLFNKKKYGTYLEIGGATPIIDNTTYLLESKFDWRGLTIEYNKQLCEQWHFRKNPCLCLDATLIDYDSLLSNHNLDNYIDFLQLDIDPQSNTLKVLENINFNKHSFSFVTFEHDYYNGGENERRLSREILLSNGYTLLISDVMHKNLKFEDWYINENVIENDNWKKFTGSEINMNSEDMPEKYINLFKQIL